MEPYKYFAVITKETNKIIELTMSPYKPDVSYLDNFVEVLELTEETYFELVDL